MALPTGTLLNETFSNPAAVNTWGVADDGHTFAVSPASAFSLDGANGNVQLNDLTVRVATPNVANAADHDGIIVLKLASLLSSHIDGPQITSYIGFRYQDVNNYYRLRVVLKADDSIWFQLQRVVGGLSTPLTANVKVATWASTADAWVFRYQIFGADTPTVRAKAWINGSGEPATWDLPSTVDSAPLTGVGGATLRALTTIGSIGLILELGEWLVDDISSTTPPPHTPSITGAPAGGHLPSGTASVALSFSSTTPPAVDHYEVNEDGAAFATHTSPYTLALAQGQSKTFYVRAMDSGGNPSGVAQVTIIRDNPSGGTSTNHYTPAAGDVGAQIRGKVLAQNAQGQSTWVYTPLSPAVTGPVSIPTNTVAPIVSGSTVRGSTLVCDGGTWSDPLAQKLYQWQDNGVDIPGETSASYITQPSDDGAGVSCDVAATNTAGTSSPVSSNVITIDASGTPPANINPPQILDVNQGATRVGDTLQVVPGDWSGTQPMTRTYKWKRSASQTGPFKGIAGATGPSYTLGPGDSNMWIEVTEFVDNGF